MGSIQWTTSHEVFVPELDDEHREIFEALSKVQDAVGSAPLAETQRLTQRLTSAIVEHFAHEERLMRAARYSAMSWHKRSHKAARRRVTELVVRIDWGDTAAGIQLVDYLTSWLRDHAAVADRMLGAFLRNQQRCMWKVTFQAGTKPLDACDWTDSRGDPFRPKAADTSR